MVICKPVCANWLLKGKPVLLQYRDMSINWTSRLARPWGRLLRPAENIPAEYVDRDAERVQRELELIRIRFPHHA
jgi:hypothetical protein